MSRRCWAFYLCFHLAVGTGFHHHDVLFCELSILNYLSGLHVSWTWALEFCSRDVADHGLISVLVSDFGPTAYSCKVRKHRLANVCA